MQEVACAMASIVEVDHALGSVVELSCSQLMLRHLSISHCQQQA
jgi:hypothetical protein